MRTWGCFICRSIALSTWDSAAATEQALKVNGNDYMVWNNLMIGYEGAQELDKAATARRKAEELCGKGCRPSSSPRDATAVSTLATFYAADKLNDKAQAEHPHISHVRLAPRSECLSERCLSNIGEAYELMGDREQALKKYVEKSIAKGCYALDDIRNTPGLQALIADPRFKPAAK